MQAIGQKPPKARVAALCFDKLDVEKGMEVRGPDGKIRRLKHPWSVLAYQIAGDEGLKLLHAEGKAEERETAPAENTLTDLLELPVKEGLGVLVLMDEVLMYAREKVLQDRAWRRPADQLLPVPDPGGHKGQRLLHRGVALGDDPKKRRRLGGQLLGDFYDIFRREKEEGRRAGGEGGRGRGAAAAFLHARSRFEKPGAFRQHVIAALKGIQAVDEQTAKAGQLPKNVSSRAIPFHPDLTEVLYAKWTQLRGFQRTRGVLRTSPWRFARRRRWDDEVR